MVIFNTADTLATDWFYLPEEDLNRLISIIYPVNRFADRGMFRDGVLHVIVNLGKTGQFIGFKLKDGGD